MTVQTTPKQTGVVAVSNVGSHALVIGGSIAGLLAARVLADHFDRVTVVERDCFPAGDEPRAGVPQGRHLHALTLRGHRVLEQLFPGLQAELVAAGAPLLDAGADGLLLLKHGYAPRVRFGLVAPSCSRALLESRIRRRVAANGKVCFQAECAVTGLVANADNTGVVGVRIRPRGRPGEATTSEEELRADLVVDASGRTSRTPQWLATLGYTPPAEIVINPFAGYATRWYQRPPDWQADWQSIALWESPTCPRGGSLLAVDGERWIVTLMGTAYNYPPTDEAGFLDFAHSLASPMLYAAIQAAHPLSPIYGYRRMENRLRYYERLARWPDGFVVLGDAVCVTNPKYTLGMTMSALGVLTLDTCLREQRRRQPAGALTGLAQRYQKRLAKVNSLFWTMATDQDLRWPTTEGGRPQPLAWLFRGYFDQVMRLMVENPQVYQVFLEVANLVRPVGALFHPRILFRVLGSIFRGSQGR